MANHNVHRPGSTHPQWWFLTLLETYNFTCYTYILIPQPERRVGVAKIKFWKFVFRAALTNHPNTRCQNNLYTHNKKSAQVGFDRNTYTKRWKIHLDSSDINFFSMHLLNKKQQISQQDEKQQMAQLNRIWHHPPVKLINLETATLCPPSPVKNGLWPDSIDPFKRDQMST